MLTFETIRKIAEEEKSSTTLTRLPDGFFADIKDYIEKKEKLSREDQDRWEIESIRRRLREIFERRERKILDATISYVRSSETPTNLLPEEEKLMIILAGSIRSFQKERDGRLQENGEPTMLLVFTKDIPRFVGLDMKHYGPFSRGSMATVPESGARILMQNNQAEKVDL